MSEHLQNYRLKMVSYLWTILTTVAACCVFVCVSREHGGCVSYPDLARALGPQKAWGFSWNRVRWRLRDWGLASSLTVKQASRLQNTHTHTRSSTETLRKHTKVTHVLNLNPVVLLKGLWETVWTWSHLGSMERILKAGLVSDSFSLFTGLAFSCDRRPITSVSK